MADPDLQISGGVGGGRGGGGPPDPEMRGEGRSGLRASFWSKDKGGRAPRTPPHGSATEIRGSYDYVAHTLTHFGTFPTDVL